jgi:hypothetical protein
MRWYRDSPIMGREYVQEGDTSKEKEKHNLMQDDHNIHALNADFKRI